MTQIELQNPSAFHALRIYQQDRARIAVDTAPAAKAPVPKRATRAELEAAGSVMTSKQVRIVTKAGAAVRDIPMPAWEAAGWSSLAEYVTHALERQDNDIRTASAVVVPVSRVRDEWGAMKPFETVAPHGKLTLPLTTEKRFVIECDEDVTLQVANQSPVRTVRLRTRDTKTGETAHAAFIAPAREYPQAACVTAGKSTAAVFEEMPS